MPRHLAPYLLLLPVALAPWGTILPAAEPAPPPVQIPAWVRETTGVGYTLSGMSREQREEAVRHGVTISEMNFVDPFYPYYDSALLHKRSPHVAIGKLDEEIAEYKRLGVRILAVYPPTLQGEVYEAHPEWRRIATDTREIPSVDMEKFGHGGMLCPLGPYGDFFIAVLEEILTKHPDVDAFSFDGLHHGGGCWCAHCRENYRADSGADIPPANLDDPAFRRYQAWADARMENLVARAQERLKRIKPEVALVTWTTNGGRFGHFLSLPRNMPARMNLQFDAPDQELWLDESNRGNTILPAFGVAYAWATTNHRVAFSEPYLMSHGNPYGKDSFPGHEILRRMMLCLTHGCGASVAVSQPPRMQQDLYTALDAVRERREWLVGVEPEPWGALVMSDATKAFYGRSAGLVEDRYLANVVGSFRAVTEEHLPVTVVEDWQLEPEFLARQKVLILPNTACLDDTHVAAIDAWVRDGGGLVASLDASLCDATGDTRGNFALAAILGVDHKGPATSASGQAAADLDVNFAKSLPADWHEKRKGVFQWRFIPGGFFLECPKIAAWVGTDPVTFKGPAVRVEPRAGTEILATIQPEGGGGPLPAVTARRHGRGRVVFLAAGVDAAYWQYPYPYERRVIASAIRWAAGENEAPVQIEAPMCVHATVRRQRSGDKNRLIVHLFNDVNTTGGHAFPVDDVPLREETLPIHGIRVTFRPGTAVERVHLEPGGQEIEVTEDDQGPGVTVPTLDVHAIVVAEVQE
jgi:type 1 glutamine amidotransferase